MIAFIDRGQHEFGRLKSRKPFGTTQAFAPTPNLPALAGEAGIGDPGVAVITEWAVQLAALYVSEP
jgi:hypothetical protein